MLIASTFRKVNLPERDMLPNAHSWRILSEIKRIEAELLPKQRPKLKSAVQASIQRSSVDYLWLKNERGVQFDTLDYDAIDGEITMPDDQPVKLTDVIEVDWERYDTLLYTFLQQEMKRGLETSLQIKGIDFRASNLSKNANRIKAKARSLFSG